MQTFTYLCSPFNLEGLTPVRLLSSMARVWVRASLNYRKQDTPSQPLNPITSSVSYFVIPQHLTLHQPDLLDISLAIPEPDFPHVIS